MKKVFTFLLILLSLSSFSQEVPFPSISIGIKPVEKPEDLVVTLEILLVLTILALAPSILVLFTSFTRIIVVFSLFRNALGTRQTPPNQVMIGLALFLTFLIMQPVWNDIYNNAITPYLKKEIGYQEMFQRINNRIREFMIKELKNHHNEDNAFMLAQNAGLEITKIEEAPNSVLIPAFVLGELEIAFKMGVVLYVPFIVIDMIVASILLSMGMIMIPPVFVSLPLKILIFVMANGWDLLVEGLIKSFAR
ncbi:flagellar type III secretion system pore protein FliP [Thermotoga sp.]|uniref:flagellar type III secretion system pore protein FliP n=1 Tax=Thermotoga sp. TaxID=28240 RepID=UPI0025E343F7|nr:flagellar type III secretion system pore protein FliP [Thermotoga sp.]MCD6551976.1 flagellar type III secretion system pore protein FliP [Thermotoga sp.]